MKAALLPDRGVVKVAGDEARTFLNGLLTADVTQVTPQSARFAALLTPQGKIIADCIVAEDAEGFFLDCPRALASSSGGEAQVLQAARQGECRGSFGFAGCPCGMGRRRPQHPRPDLRRSAACRARLPRHPAGQPGRASRHRSRRATGRCLGLRGASHRARRAARRARLRLWRRLPARGRHGPAQRRRLRQGLLRRAGGRVAHRASRHRAQSRRAGRRRRQRARRRRAGDGGRQAGRL